MIDAGDRGAAWTALSPRFVWRPSQRHLLDLASAAGADRRWHLCAPPGSGKTLIGLELARRVARPALVLSPTTAVRDQWCSQTAMFGAEPAAFASTDPDRPAPLLSVTYQLLGNPGRADDDLRQAARRLWLARLVGELGEEAATARITAVEAGDPARAAAELGRHLRGLRRSLGTGDDIGVEAASLLGERTALLIDRLAGLGIGCVVLDECHHLLDWWALVIRALMDRLPTGTGVIGLTATPPEPDNEREAANYRGLLGEIDAELHLAALVAEGALAPWRDGIHAVALTPAESAFVEDWSARFASELDSLIAEEAVIAWAVGQVVDAAQGHDTWKVFWDRDPLAARALARWWSSRGMSLPVSVSAPPAALADTAPTLNDRLVLLDAWLHDPAATIPDDLRAEVMALARRHGVTFTTAGVRRTRSVADLVCSRSAAKGVGAAQVLADEAARRGSSMRAVVVVERDAASTPPAAARSVLGEDVGTAAGVIAALCARREVLERGVIAVTGRGAWCDGASASRVVEAVRVSGVGDGTPSTRGCDIRGAVELTVDGARWSPSQWLAAAEAAMDDGAVGVLVATRGLVGEGWDHPPINVLVDLSEAATATSATQLRGRALRLDPEAPDKTASLWDVVAVHPDADGDWQRLRRRHRHWWGPSASGEIVTGPGKLHDRVARAEPPGPDELEAINDAADHAMADTAATRAAWSRIDPAGMATTAVLLSPLPGRRVRRRVRTRPATARRRLAAGGVAALGAAAAAVVLAAWPVAAAAAVPAMAAAWIARSRRSDERDALAAIGDAVAAGLGLRAATTRVGVEADGSLVAVLEARGADELAITRWADALAEVIGPLGSPRWMVATADRTWRVPMTIGASREAAENFARTMRRRLPGARLVRAGTPEATAMVLAASRERADDVSATLRWR